MTSAQDGFLRKIIRWFFPLKGSKQRDPAIAEKVIARTPEGNSPSQKQSERNLTQGDRDALNAAIKNSKFHFKKERGGASVEGDIVGKLIANSRILELVDMGALSIWSETINKKVVTHIVEGAPQSARYRDFGVFHHNRRFTLNELQYAAKQKVPIDATRTDMYPWRYKYKLFESSYDQYYHTKDWDSVRGQFYRTSNPWIFTCTICSKKFEKEEKLLLDLHHITTMRNGGSNDTLNLTSLCCFCHAAVHNRLSILTDSLFQYFVATGKPVWDYPQYWNKTESAFRIRDTFLERVQGKIYAGSAKLFLARYSEYILRYDDFRLGKRIEHYLEHGNGREDFDAEVLLVAEGKKRSETTAINSDKTFYSWIVTISMVYTILLQQAISYRKRELKQVEAELAQSLKPVLFPLQEKESGLAMLFHYARHEWVCLPSEFGLTEFEHECLGLRPSAFGKVTKRWNEAQSTYEARREALEKAKHDHLLLVSKLIFHLSGYDPTPFFTLKEKRFHSKSKNQVLDMLEALNGRLQYLLRVDRNAINSRYQLLKTEIDDKVNEMIRLLPDDDLPF